MLKKVVGLLSLVFILFFTGCQTQDSVRKPVNLKEITGNIEKANIKDDKLIIDKNDITTEITYIDYEYEGVTIGLFAVRDSNNQVKVMVNTCQSCGGSPYAYFVQVNDKIQCQNCGNLFEIDNLDNLVESGCNPIAISNKEENDQEIKIDIKELNELKPKFENWQGPKAL